MTHNMHDYKKVVDRFSGNAEHYHKFRPQPPETIFKILTKISNGSTLDTVVDLGCGTGISTFPWIKYAQKIIGIDPSDDMIDLAKTLFIDPKISFEKGYGHDMPIKTQTIDILASSQAIHWMEPTSTFKEILRVLKPQGVFAAYGPQVPFLPLGAHKVASAYNEFMNLVKKVDDENSKYQKPTKWKWNDIYSYMKQSNHFAYTDELCFHKTLKWDWESYCGWVLSFSYVNALITKNDEINKEFESFTSIVKQCFGKGKIECLLSYRLLLGVKH